MSNLRLLLLLGFVFPEVNSSLYKTGSGHLALSTCRALTRQSGWSGGYVKSGKLATARGRNEQDTESPNCVTPEWACINCGTCSRTPCAGTLPLQFLWG